MPEERDNAPTDFLEGLRPKNASLSLDETLVRGEQLPGACVARALERAGGEGVVPKLERSWVRVRIARDLTEDEVASASIGEYDRRTELRPREIGEGKGDEMYAYITSAKMLYGLALETAFKAYILRSKPEDVSFKMSADGTGKVQDVEMKQFGVSMGTGHNLGVCPANA